MNKRIALAAVCSALSLCTLTTGFTLKNTTVRPPEADHGVIVSQPTKMAALDPAATKGYELVTKISKLAKSEDYIKLMSASPEINDIIKKIADGSYTTPVSVYRADISDENINALLDAELSSDITDIVRPSLVNSLPIYLISTEGSSELAAASIVTASETYVDSAITNPVMFVYNYDGDYSVIVTEVPGTDGAVTATAYFVKNSVFKGTTKDDVADTFKEKENVILSFMEVRY